MTCNQLMVLLDIHRGTFRESRHMGTVSKDILYLLRRGLITPGCLADEPEQVVTDDGVVLVATILQD